jgi:hypothetical protein
MEEIKLFFQNAMVGYVLLFGAMVLAIQLVRLLEAKRKELSERYQDGDDMLYTLDRLAELAVKSVEQLWSSAQIEKDERREAAANVINAYLKSRGVDFPTEIVFAAIEKAVLQLNAEKPKL